MHDERINEVLTFWQQIGPQGWYDGTAGIDDAVRTRFVPLWHEARGDGLFRWGETASGALARILVLDQFPRNMFRDHADSFATDDLALMAAGSAIGRGFDLEVAPPLRQFFYLPLMHAENLSAQEHCIVLFTERMPGDNEIHARAHRHVIARFGRFPWRNAALGRRTTASEAEFLAAGGYAAVVASIPPLRGGAE